MEVVRIRVEGLTRLIILLTSEYLKLRCSEKELDDSLGAVPFRGAQVAIDQTMPIIMYLQTCVIIRNLSSNHPWKHFGPYSCFYLPSHSEA